jgi:hypothetical protein
MSKYLPKLNFYETTDFNHRLDLDHGASRLGRLSIHSNVAASFWDGETATIIGFSPLKIPDFN